MARVLRGGVVTIVTKRPEIFTGSVGLQANMPDSDLEGGSVRTSFMLAGPMGENWSFRVCGHYNKSDPDSTTRRRLPTQGRNPRMPGVKAS